VFAYQQHSTFKGLAFGQSEDDQALIDTTQVEYHHQVMTPLRIMTSKSFRHLNDSAAASQNIELYCIKQFYPFC